MLPKLSVTLPVIFALWVIGGLIKFGPVILVYPAMWAAVAALFFVLQKTSGEVSPVTAASNGPSS